MAKRKVVTPFTLVTHDSERQFSVGETIEGELADHWYVQHHTEEDEKKPTKPATPRSRE